MGTKRVRFVKLWDKFGKQTYILGLKCSCGEWRRGSSLQWICWLNLLLKGTCSVWFVGMRWNQLSMCGGIAPLPEQSDLGVCGAFVLIDFRLLA